MPKGKYYGGSAPRKFDHDEIMRLVEAGMPKVEIARVIGCQRNLVYTVIKKHNQSQNPK